MSVNTNTNQIEKEILSNIEKLIAIICKINQQDKENFNSFVPEAEYIISKTNPLLEQLLQRKGIPLEQIYRQLITQKLPYTETQNSISHLEEALEHLFALPVFHQDNKKEPLTDTSEDTTTLPPTENKCPSEKSKVGLFDYLTALFPREKMLKNYYIRNIKLDYFIPRKKLAILLTPVYYRRSLNHNLLLREGIHLIELSPHDLDNPYQLYQKFWRHAL